MKLISIFWLLSLVGCTTPHCSRPSDGYVPDSITAERIAEAVWLPIYGEKIINREKPFIVKRKGKVWRVEGNFPYGLRTFGGVAEIEIDAITGKILNVSHGQ